jgi:flagellar export protein FliJ
VKSFHFPLQRVLDWRTLQMRTEEERLAAFQHSLAVLIHRENALVAAELKTQVSLLKLPLISGPDLQSLAAFQARMKTERVALKAKRVQCEAQIAEQRKRLLKARRDLRVLEKLKERRWKSWTYLTQREIESTAAEAYISRWIRSELEQ